jgi:hypothetical protein
MGTNLTGPISQGEKTGNPQTQTVSYVKVVRQVSLGVGAARQVITIPPNSTLLGFAAVPTSGFTGGEVRDMNVNFGTSADPVGFGLLQVANNATTFKDVSVRTRQVSVGAGSLTGTISLPPKSTLLRIGAIETSAIAGTDAATAARVNFGSPGDVDQYGIVTGVSAKASLIYTTPVSGANEFDSGGIIVVSISADATSVITGGGARAFVEYAVAENASGNVEGVPASGAASFDAGGTIVLTLSAAATTTFTAGGVRAMVEYLTVE